MNVRRLLYNKGVFSVWYAPVPVCIVGNITVGGTGKTPLVIWLAKWLIRRGVKVGIVSRGYGGKVAHYPVAVSEQSLCREVGEENVLIYQSTKVPVVVDPLRVRATQYLLENHTVDIVLADDGLQHYKLGRNVECAVLDGARRIGNGLLLPFGPLREPKKRLNDAQWVVVKGDSLPFELKTHVSQMELTPVEFVNLGTDTVLAPEQFRTKFSGRIRALAAIGNPKNFQDTLKQIGIQTQVQVFQDHHYFSVQDLTVSDSPIVVTEKDAQKIRELAMELHHIWYLRVNVTFCKSVDEYLSSLFSQQGVALEECN